MGDDRYDDLTEPFELRRAGERDWVIYDRRVPSDDARCVVAHIFENDEDAVDVVWLDGRALPTAYLSARAVLDDVIIAARRGAGGTRPIQIPAFPPPVAV